MPDLTPIPGKDNWELNSSFSAFLPRFQIAWDSTSSGVLKECPRKYYYTIILGIAPREESVHLTFGRHYHTALEHYDHGRSAGLDHQASVRKALRCVLGITWNRALGRPWISTDANKNRRTLVRTVLWYLDNFEHDSLHTIQLASGKPAVELSFRVPLGDASRITGEDLTVCGHMDRMVEFNEDHYVLDRKTTKHPLDASYFAQYSPDNQFSGYTYGGTVGYSQPIKGLIVDGAQVLTQGSRFLRGIVKRTPEQLEEWRQDLVLHIQHAGDFAEANYWPMNDKACSNYGGCWLRGICAKSPQVREQWLRSDFVKKRWDPLQVRGDI